MTAPAERHPIEQGQRRAAAACDLPPLNPWISIWIRPRATLRQILDSDPVAFVWLLAAFGGIARALDRASIRSAGDHLSLSALLIACVIGGALSGILMLYLFGAVMRWTGHWLGGVATAEEMRAAIAWPHVVTTWALGLWLPELAIFGKELFTTETPRMDANPLLVLLLLGFFVVEIVVGIWFVVVLLKCVGEAQGFSAWKALANTFLAGLILVSPFIALGILIAIAVQ